MSAHNSPQSIPTDLITRLPTRVFEPPRGFVPIRFAELWRYRELAWFLALRDIQVRYKQTVLGALWAVIPPVFTMIAFQVLFRLMGTMPVTDDSTAVVTMYCAMLPWFLFTHSLTNAGNSLVGNAELIKKIYFPRLITPIAPLGAGLLDHVIAFTILAGMMAWYSVAPNGWAMLALPLFTLLAIATALGASLWLSALNAVYRDVKYTIPLIVSMGMYISPVVYETAAIIPEKWRTIYSLNPMVSVIEGYRWALLGKPAPDPMMLAMSVLTVSIVLIGGLFYFRRMERTFADVV